MPKEQTERKNVKLQRIRSKEAENARAILYKSSIGLETALRSSKAEKAEMKAKEETKGKK